MYLREFIAFPLRTAILRQRSGPALVLLTLCSFVGCGGPATGQVTGAVRLDGIKLGGAELFFQSVSNPDDLFLAVTSRNGTYEVSYRELDGLPVGRYTVTIRIYTLPGGAPFPPGERAEELKAEGKLVQASYVFEKDVASGQNTIDLELTQEQKQEAQAESSP